jgi:CheY-like chemotaxis protein
MSTFPRLSREGEPSRMVETNRVNAERTRHRVLVADDNIDAAETLGMLLRLAGQEVVVAHGGVAAIEQALAHVPEIVVLDIGMPDVDGYEVCRRLRQEPSTQNALLIAVTGWGQDADRTRSHDAGFDHHFVKPVEWSTLEKLLAGLDRQSEPEGEA